MVVGPSNTKVNGDLVEYITHEFHNFADEEIEAPAAGALVKVENYVYQQDELLSEPTILQPVPQLVPVPTIARKEPETNQHEMNFPSMICNVEFGGNYEFEVFINPHHGKKSPWIYSSALNKIFIGVNILFPIDFKFKSPPEDKKFYVRATPIYSETQHSMEMVLRCINHAQANEPTNAKYGRHIWDHILRCHSREASYGGSKDEGRHLYVRIPLGQPPEGTEAHQFQYQFMCKNSCGSSGMNRRALEVVFTLEDEAGEVLGRRVLSVRICSCPKRDKQKEEQEHYNKAEPAQAKAKKRKMEKRPNSSMENTLDLKEYQVTLPVLGAANARLAMKLVYSLMAGEMVQHNMLQHPSFKKCLKEIEQKMKAPLE